MVKSMKMHKMQNALSARLMVNMDMASYPTIQPAILMCDMLVPDNYGHIDSVEELQVGCGSNSGFFFCFGNFICIRIRLTSCERDYNCQSDI